MYRMDPERNSQETSREEDHVLHGVEARAGEGRGVVALVVELVDVLVQEAALVRCLEGRG